MDKIIFQESLQLKSHKNALACLKHFPDTACFPPEKICFFDIETTGLSAAVSSVYLIGCGMFKNDCFHIVQ
ncbi:MAG: ribonuclease H-like domain-containing protein, partial [Lachnoclostridium sp.]|nr:ribonuclease H-like domain-containing protein [Lachnoclostridium sp.]